MPRLLRPVALVVALLLVGSAAAAQTPSGLESELEERQRERARVERQLEDNDQATGTAQERLAAADRELAAAEAELAQVQEAMAAAEERRDRAREAAATARAEHRDVVEELARSEAELEVIQEQFDRRVVGSFKRGTTHNELTVIQQMLAADDIADALAQRPFLSAVLDSDRRLVDDVRALVARVEDQRAQAERRRVTAESEAAAAAAAAEEIAEQLVAQEALTDQVAARRQARDEALEALRDDRATIEDHLAGLDAESQRIQDQLAAIAAQQAAEEAARAAEQEAARAAEEQARRDAEAAAAEETGAEDADDAGEDRDGEASPPPAPAPPPPSGGGWTRPTPGHVTSGYGPRWGRMHHGVDLAGAVGTGVVAARGGTVVHVTSSCHPTSSRGCGGGFGNYVTIAHDGGLATVYAHLSSVHVGVGQAVSAGQSIGAVGNSGNSTGPHLHFEVREGGSPRDPCRYISC